MFCGVLATKWLILNRDVCVYSLLIKQNPSSQKSRVIERKVWDCNVWSIFTSYDVRSFIHVLTVMVLIFFLWRKINMVCLWAIFAEWRQFYGCTHLSLDYSSESHLGQDQIVQTSTLQGSLSNAVLRLTFQSVCFSAIVLILCHQGHTLPSPA